MKKINNIVRGLLVAVLSVGIVSPSVVFATSVSLSGSDVRSILTSGTTNYVSDFNYNSIDDGYNVLKVDNLTVPASAKVTNTGNLTYGLSFNGTNLFTATGKDGLFIYDASLTSPISYTDGASTYKKVQH